MLGLLGEQYRDLDQFAADHVTNFRQAQPFPHLVLPDFIDPEVLRAVEEECGDLRVAQPERRRPIRYNNGRERKLASRGCSAFGPRGTSLLAELHSAEFRAFLQRLTTIQEPLLADPELVGGGLHQINPDGLLKLHVDFNKHKKRPDWDRRLNLLIYLNQDWQEDYGGHLELWDSDPSKCGQRILPTFNTAVLFATTSFSYHGHPDPLTCPPDRVRKSIALYYYSEGRPAAEIDPYRRRHGTRYRPRPGNQQDSSDWAQ